MLHFQHTLNASEFAGSGIQIKKQLNLHLFDACTTALRRLFLTWTCNRSTFTQFIEVDEVYKQISPLLELPSPMWAGTIFTACTFFRE